MEAWLAALQERPSFQACFYPGARISERYPEVYRTAREIEAERGY